MKFSGKFKYKILFIFCASIFIYGFFSVNIKCTEKFSLGENKNNEILLGDNKTIIKIREDKAPVKSSNDEKEGLKVSIPNYDIVFSKKPLSDFKSYVAEKFNFK
ncbi:hypothetical protein [Clostridium hydrogeniformans]|uniref:hypothetical protein n=1 Tax=Clostridium hydrogeniformans TaxID=349933 RepID=UPI000482E467|nr:hypothetical protein [Clostridium hydrogeniformans]